MSVLAGEVANALDLALAVPGVADGLDLAEWEPLHPPAPVSGQPGKKGGWWRKALIFFTVAVLVAAAVAGTAEAVWRWAPKPTVQQARPIPQPRPTTTPSAPGITVVSGLPFDLPDPMLVADGSSYVAFFSTSFLDHYHYAVPEVVGVPGAWGPPTDALPTLPTWAAPLRTHGRSTDKIWAPYVARVGSQYVMYFAAYSHGDHCIGVAVAAEAVGPFTPVPGPPLVCQRQFGGDIDAQPFYDPAGPRGSAHPWYLVWKSDNNHIKQKQTYIWSAPLSNDGLSLTGTRRAIYTASQKWQLPVLEAPQMVISPWGQVWLFYSAGRGFNRNEYAMGEAYCAGPLGPCSSYGSGPLVSSNSQGVGPGEETAFRAPDDSLWLLYNPWRTGTLAVIRPAEGIRIGWTRLGPYVAQAGTFPSPLARPPVPQPLRQVHAAWTTHRAHTVRGVPHPR